MLATILITKVEATVYLQMFTVLCYAIVGVIAVVALYRACKEGKSIDRLCKKINQDIADDERRQAEAVYFTKEEIHKWRTRSSL